MEIEGCKPRKPPLQPARPADEERISGIRRDTAQRGSAERALETQIASARRIAEKRRKVLRELGK